ncbi:HAMP domain-containing histidine kinase, partial [Candidatus Poribacteria bacterium]|nr:HAMP domain-containing histidine kinase [Candidatus Poribacteria bacterium]
MHSNGRRLARTIANIVDIERIESGSGALNNAELVVDHVMQGAILACEDDARLASVQLRSSVLAPRASVWGDEQRLRDAITHVIGNAVKFSPPGGTVAVCLIERDRTVRVLVEDQGPGIPDAARETIFRKFAQLDASDAREAGGLGLGLAIAKAIVEKHHGDVDFECGQQGGTTFVIDLPAFDRPAS